MLNIINALGAELMPVLGVTKFYVSTLPDATKEPVSFAIRFMPSSSPDQYYTGTQLRRQNIQILTQGNEAKALEMNQKAFKHFFRRNMTANGLSIISVDTVSEPSFLSVTNNATIYTCAIAIEYKEE